MGFELFRGRGSSGKLTVSIRQSNSIGISSAVGEEYFEENDYAEMYYDRENARVGIKPLDDETKHSYKIRRNTNSAGGAINCQAFLDTHSLVGDETEKYQVHWDEEEELLYFNLEEDKV